MLTKHPRIRLAVYLVGLALGGSAAIVGATIGTDLGTALSTSGGFLMAAALGVAAANTPTDPS
jgi:hypothetical protein